MSNRYARILAAGGVALLVAALGTTALAATTTTWTIQPGGAIQVMSGKLVFIDTTTGTVVSCRSSAASGTLKSGTGLPGFHVGSLSAVSFSTCVGADGPKFTFQPGALPWHLNFSSYNAAKGMVRGRISHLHIGLTGVCVAVIDGTGATAGDGQVVFRYTDSTGQLTVLATDGNLHFYDVSSGCLGLVNTGDRATLSVTYTVTPKQAITSP